jgi:hypothetical protein
MDTGIQGPKSLLVSSDAWLCTILAIIAESAAIDLLVTSAFPTPAAAAGAQPASDDPFDVLIIDADQIRQSERTAWLTTAVRRFPKVPILVIADSDTPPQPLLDIAWSYVPKSFGPDAIIDSILLARECHVSPGKEQLA